MQTEDLNEGAARRAAQDEVLVAALAAGRTYEAAGQLAGISGRTVARRMTDPAFARQVAARRDEQVHTLAGLLSSLSAAAVAAVASCLDDEDPKNRLAAAKLILDHGPKLHHQLGVATDIAEIRRQLGMDS
jgi:HPt (histidine-containing phosphotransfer) domain-containing protein